MPGHREAKTRSWERTESKQNNSFSGCLCDTWADAKHWQYRDVAMLKEKAGRCHNHTWRWGTCSLKPWGSICETDRWDNRDPTRIWCLLSSIRAGDTESRKPLSQISWTEVAVGGESDPANTIPSSALDACFSPGSPGCSLTFPACLIHHLQGHKKQMFKTTAGALLCQKASCTIC